MQHQLIKITARGKESTYISGEGCLLFKARKTEFSPGKKRFKQMERSWPVLQHRNRWAGTSETRTRKQVTVTQEKIRGAKDLISRETLLEKPSPDVWDLENYGTGAITCCLNTGVNHSPAGKVPLRALDCRWWKSSHLWMEAHPITISAATVTLCFPIS